MKKIIITNLVFTLMYLSFLGFNSYAGEAVLCISEADQYVAVVNEKGDCLEDEKELVINRSDMGQKKAFTPLANFNENTNCDGEGTTTEVGFDENDNDSLDQNEIISKSGVCNPTVAENEE